jgi:diguanylate cyclase (GGDEF)-like protein
MKKSIWFALAGFIIGSGAPIGALILQSFLQHSTLSFLPFAFQEWSKTPFFYEYMLVSTCLVMSVLGYFIGRNADLINEQNHNLALQATHDSLTGLENHRRMHEVFQTEFKKHLDVNRPISCLMMDLDHFKRVNDAHGHPFGDKVLRDFAKLILRCIRQGDVAARYGGEEFLCILPDCGEENAKRAAERIRRETEAFVFHKGQEQVKITTSLGVVTAYGMFQSDYRAMIEMADKNLYKAKQEGRNRAVHTVAGKPMPPVAGG